MKRVGTSRNKRDPSATLGGEINETESMHPLRQGRIVHLDANARVSVSTNDTNARSDKPATLIATLVGYFGTGKGMPVDPGAIRKLIRDTLRILGCDAKTAKTWSNGDLPQALAHAEKLAARANFRGVEDGARVPPKVNVEALWKRYEEAGIPLHSRTSAIALVVGAALSRRQIARILAPLKAAELARAK